jgi:hypothetical protein
MISYTLILSRGTHVVSPAAAAAILDALASRAALVSIDIDLLCDGFIRPGVKLATSHVVALIPNESSVHETDEIPCGSNITALRRAR